MAIDLVHFHNPTYKVRDVKGGEETERGGEKGRGRLLRYYGFPRPDLGVLE